MTQLTTELKTTIQSAYRAWLAAMDFKPRASQKKMIAKIVQTIDSIESTEGKRASDNGLVLIEAGTGIGKTLAYLIALVPIAKALQKQLVVATATVTLQEQLFSKDIPSILEHTELQFSATLAKGRGRYLCLLQLDRHKLQQPMVEQKLIFGLNTHQKTVLAKEFYEKLDTEFRDERWDGQREHWSGKLDDNVWHQVTSDSNTCTGSRCNFYSDCPFYKARRDMEKHDLIVTNHDLLLADLALGGGIVLPQPDDTIYVIDEGHKLPSKAINSFSHNIPIQDAIKWLERLAGFFDGLRKNELQGEWAQMIQLAEDIAHQIIDLDKLLGTLFNESPTTDTTFRFTHGIIPQILSETSNKLSEKIIQINKEIQIVLKKDDQDETLNSEYRTGLTIAETRLKKFLALFQDYANAPTEEPEEPTLEETNARWIRNLATNATEEQTKSFILESSPVVANKILNDRLWQKAFATVITSATLRELGSFEYYRNRSGIPEYATHDSFSSPFNYPEVAVLSIPRGCQNGRNIKAHTQSLIDLLPSLVEDGVGTLVLFFSWRQLRLVRQDLPSTFQEQVISQGEYPQNKILTLHKQRVDAGQTSVLFGVESFAEGIDLPGSYCQHVIITKLPFPAPSEPIYATLSEWVEDHTDGNSFWQLSVPSASLKLTQASGRLLRNEADQGRVTILDNRILTSSYGKALLSALPPFRQEFSFLNTSIPDGN